VSLALVLRLVRGLLGKAFWRLTNVAPGFNPQSVLTLRVDLPEARYGEIARQTQFRQHVLDHMNSSRAQRQPSSASCRWQGTRSITTS
jgi:hypothetical protein